MHRSASTSRASDEFYLSTAKVAPLDHLPTYDPQSEAAKKEALRLRFAENMVHLIPLVLILCAILLWFFSYPDIDVMSHKDSTIVARIKNMTIDGYSNWNGTSMTIGMDDLDPIDGIGNEDSGRDSDHEDPVK